mgnify:FL=1
MAVSCTIVAFYGGGSLTFATEPSGSGSVNSFYWKAEFLNVQDDAALNASGQIYWEITRQSGTGSDFSATSGTSSGVVTYNSGGVVHAYMPIQAYFTDDTVDETTGIGENFTVSVYLNSSKTTLYASQTFKLYDADFNISGPSGTSVFNIAYGATSQNVTFTQGGATETNARSIVVRNASTNAVLFYDTWGATEYYNHTITIPNAYLPSAGSTSSYYIQVYNGQSYYTVGNTFTITRAAGVTFTQPVASGVLVVDETTVGSVTSTFQISNTGAGGTFWAMQRPTSYNPAINDPNWVQYSVTDNSSTSFNFNQTRGTIQYYYTRRYDSGTNTQSVGRTINQSVGQIGAVSERVPTTPVISSVTIGSGTHNVVLSNNPPADGITVVYYYQSTNASAMASQSAWVDSGSGSVPAGWQSGSNFSATTGVTYYYWALGWAVGGGDDGATLSNSVSQLTASASGAVGVVGQSSANDYGLEVYNSAGQLRVGTLDRTSLFLGSHSVTLGPSGQASGVQVSGATSSDCYAIDLTGSAAFAAGLTFTFGTDTLSITGGSAGQNLSFFVVRS